MPRYWPSARHFTEAIQCPSVCFAHPLLQDTLPAVDRLGMPLVTSGQFAYVYKLKSLNGGSDFAVRCFRGYLGDRDQRYRAIQEHVQTAPVGYLSDFSYASEGILVGGNRFPILFMNWIEGPTLDLYIGEMIQRPDVLLHLAGEWLKLLHALRVSGVAHGDLQHGNIIVEHGQLRLVDHDGIFVPKMEGWTACEVGHQHYQHPQRGAHHFDAKLDNFSSLVIYLSLLSLAERPDLWNEYHDENLIFSRTDFGDPASSSLFRRIREIGPEHSRLADVLAGAAIKEPGEVPFLLDLVKTKTSLPSWMTAPADIDANTKTREVARTEPALGAKKPRWTPWQEKSRGPGLPSTPSSSTVQTLFGGTPPAPAVVRDPSDVLGNAIFYTKDFLRRYYLIWFWATYIVLTFLGLDFAMSLFTASLCLSIGCLTFGLVRSADEAVKAKRTKMNATWQPSSLGAPATVRQRSLPVSWNPPVSLPTAAVNAGSSEPFVGNLVLGIYHLETCDWVNRISSKNRVGFATASEAISHGFKPCRICSPA